MKRLFTTSVLALLLAVGLIPLFAGGAAAQSNSVTFTIRGGDAHALALCLNAVKRGDRIYQANHCRNTAIAAGGKVYLRNVSIFVVQTNDPDGDISNASNTVDLTIRGGDANALAACVNAVKYGDTVYQQNNCKNKAVAIGGDVVLSNVDITIIQENL
ncbi:MAG: hypothetical protein QOJ59_3501 [Thermomicrobiales bacterium]|jgi:hypothetical protein|nr:hypothetical protein [Thermomicrobiales bacterium]